MGRIVSDIEGEIARMVRDLPAMTDAQRDAQRRSFAFGNTHLADPNVTRAMVDEAAVRIPLDHPPGSAHAARDMQALAAFASRFFMVWTIAAALAGFGVLVAMLLVASAPADALALPQKLAELTLLMAAFEAAAFVTAGCLGFALLLGWMGRRR